MAPGRPPRRRPSRRPPQFNAEVDALLRRELLALGRVWGGNHGPVLRILVDIALGRRPSLSLAHRAFFDAIMREPPEEPPGRRPRRGPTA